MTYLIETAEAAIFMVFLLFVLGIPLTWMSRARLLAVPGIGFMIFLSIITAVSQMINIYSAFITTSCIIGYLLIALFLFSQKKLYKTPFKLLERLIVIIFSFLIFLTTLFTVTKHPVPMGADAIGHAYYAIDILVTKQFNAQYPLASHHLLAYISDILNIPIHEALQGFHIAIYVIYFLSIFSLVYEIFKRYVPAAISLLMGLITVSFYNNLLNGSTTHLIGTMLVIVAVTLVLNRIENYEKASYFLVVLISFIAFQYAHPTSMIYALIAISAIRFVYAIKNYYSLHSINYLSAILLSILLSIPLHLDLLNNPKYNNQLLLFIITPFLIEILITFSIKIIHIIKTSPLYGLKSQIIQKILFNISGILIAFLFYHAWSKDWFLPAWYGLLASYLALFGTLLIFNFYKDYSFATIWLFAITGIYLLYFNLPTNIAKYFWIVYKLIYFNGFTVLIILLSAIPVVYVYDTILHNKIIKQKKIIVILVTLLLITYPMLVLSARTFDKNIDTVLSIDKYGESRTGRHSGGFGVFGTWNDVNLSVWARNNLHDNGIVLNLGGYYGAWFIISGHKVVFERGGPWPYNIQYNPSNILNIMKDMQMGLYQTIPYLRDMNIKYIFVSEKNPIILSNPYLKLIHKEGSGSRIYKILAENEINSSDLPYIYLDADSLLSLQKTIIGNPHKYRIHLKRSGQKIYTQPYGWKKWRVDGWGMLSPKGKIYIPIPLPSKNNIISVKSAQYAGDMKITLKTNDEIKYQTIKKIESGTNFLLKDIPIQSTSQELELIIENAGNNTVTLFNIEIYLKKQSGKDILPKNIYRDLIKNSGFENGTEGWKASVGRDILINTTVFHNGSKSLEIKPMSGYNYAHHIAIPISSSAMYRLSLWIKKGNNASREDSLILVVWLDSDYKYITNTFAYPLIETNNNWTYNSYLIVSPSNAVYGEIRIFNRAQTSIWIDDVSFIEKPYLDDINIALWIKNNIPYDDNAYILNIGRSNSGWFPAMSQHKTIYNIYGSVLSKNNTEFVNKCVEDMKLDKTCDISKLNEMGIKYIYIAESYPNRLHIEKNISTNPNFKLIYRVGDSSIYELISK